MDPLDHLPGDRPFTRVQAHKLGVSDHALTRLLRDGTLRRTLRSVYVNAAVEESLDLRHAVLQLVVPPGFFVCDRTAAWLYVGARALAPNEHLFVPPLSCFAPADQTRLRNDLTVSGRRRVLPGDLREIDGMLVTTPLRTALDLGRLGGGADLRLAGMDAMLSLGTFRHEDLLAEVPRFKGERGVVMLRELAFRADGGSESFGESALRNRWYDAGLPRPRTQVPVLRGTREPLRIDLGNEAEHFGAEYDGAEAHGPDQVEHDEERRAYLHQRGWHLEVFRSAHTFGVRQNAEERLRQAWALVAGGARGRRYFA